MVSILPALKHNKTVERDSEDAAAHGQRYAKNRISRLWKS